MLEEARAALLAVGDRERAAEADALLGEISWIEGRNDVAFAHLERGLDLVRDAPAVAGKGARADAAHAVPDARGRLRPRASRARRSSWPKTFGPAELHAHALITIGTGRFKRRRLGGREEIEQGLELALAREPARGGRPRVLESRLARRRRRGPARRGASPRPSRRRRWRNGWAASTSCVGHEATRSSSSSPSGSGTSAPGAADEYLAESDSFGPHYQDCAVLGARAIIRLGPGRPRGRARRPGRRRSRRRGSPRIRRRSTLRCACPRFVLADVGPPRRRLASFFDELFSQGPKAFDHADHAIGDLIWLANVLDRREEARRRSRRRSGSPWTAAGRALLDDDYASAIEIFERGHALRSAASTRLLGGRGARRRGPPRRGRRAPAQGARVLPLGRRDALDARGRGAARRNRLALSKSGSAAARSLCSVPDERRYDL